MDDIDTSHWLPRGSSVVNAYRAQKGDLDLVISDGRISSATPIDQSLLGWLIDRGILGEDDRTSAMVFQDMQACFRRPVSHKGYSVYALEFIGGGTPSDMETLYLRICRIIAGKNESYITHAINQKAVALAKHSAWANRGHYQQAFESLKNAIDKVCTDYREQQKNNNNACAR